LSIIFIVGEERGRRQTGGGLVVRGSVAWPPAAEFRIFGFAIEMVSAKDGCNFALSCMSFYFAIMSCLKAMKLQTDFNAVYDSYYSLNPTTEFCVTTAVLDGVKFADDPSSSNFGDDSNPPIRPLKEKPNLICSDAREPLWSPYFGDSDGNVHEGSLNSRRLHQRLLVGRSLARANASTDPWINEKYHMNTASKEPGDIEPVFSFCTENYDCSRNRSNFGYPNVADPNAGDFAFCVHKNITCGNKEWCAQFAELAIEGDYGVCEKCEGCLCNSSTIFVLCITLTILSSCCGCIGFCLGSKKLCTDEDAEDTLEMIKAAGLAKRCCGMTINAVIIIIVLAYETAFFFEKLNEADCMDSEGAKIMKTVEVTNQELVTNIIGCFGLNTISLIYTLYLISQDS